MGMGPSLLQDFSSPTCAIIKRTVLTIFFRWFGHLFLAFLPHLYLVQTWWPLTCSLICSSVSVHRTTSLYLNKVTLLLVNYGKCLPPSKATVSSAKALNVSIKSYKLAHLCRIKHDYSTNVRLKFLPGATVKISMTSEYVNYKFNERNFAEQKNTKPESGKQLHLASSNVSLTIANSYVAGLLTKNQSITCSLDCIICGLITWTHTNLPCVVSKLWSVWRS